MNTGESELDQLRRMNGQRAEALDRANRRSVQQAAQIELLQIAHEQSKAKIKELSEALRDCWDCLSAVVEGEQDESGDTWTIKAIDSINKARAALPEDA